MNNLKILYEDNHIIVVIKPYNVPVQADSSNDLDMLTIIKNYIKKKYNKPGNVYLGLVHRLDRPVGGIMVFAKTSKCASRLSEQIRTKKFKKVYNAVCVGKIDDSGKLVDYLLKDRKKNIVKVDNSGKECILYYKRLNYKNNLLECNVYVKPIDKIGKVVNILNENYCIVNINNNFYKFKTNEVEIV